MFPIDTVESGHDFGLRTKKLRQERQNGRPDAVVVDNINLRTNRVNGREKGVSYGIKVFSFHRRLRNQGDAPILF